MSLPRYSAYGQSGVKWLGDIPEHWVVRRLKYLCEAFPSNVDKHSKDGETPVRLCNYTDVYYNDVIGSTLEFMEATATEDEIARFSLKADDVLITKDSETADDIAVSAYVPSDLAGVLCGYHLSILRPRTGVSGRYLKYLFDAAFLKAAVEVAANGLTRVALGQAEVDGLALPKPPLAEQLAIAAFLDRETSSIDALIEEQRKLVSGLSAKRRAIASKAFWSGTISDLVGPSSSTAKTTPVLPLKRVLQRIEQGWSPMCDSRPASEGEWGVLKVGCVNDERFDVNEQKALPGSVSPPLEYEVAPGDVLMSRGNTASLVGMASVATQAGSRLLLSDLLYRLRFDPARIDAQYLVLWLRSEFGRYQIERLATGTSASMKKISQGDIAEIRIPTPPLKQQRSMVATIGAALAKIDAVISCATEAVGVLKERRAALISATVTGQVDVRRMADGEAA